MAVALGHRRIGGEAIEITVALRIPHPDAFAARQNDAERLVVAGAEARFRRDEIRDRWIHPWSLQLQRTGTSWVSNRARQDLMISEFGSTGSEAREMRRTRIDVR